MMKTAGTIHIFIVILCGGAKIAEAQTSSPVFTPQAYGAKCDGSTSDSTAISQAATAAASNGLPLEIDGQCASSTPIAITSVSSGILRIQGTGKIITHGNSFLRIATNTSYKLTVQISGLRIVDNAPASNTYAIELDGSSGGGLNFGSYVRDLAISGYSDGILFDGVGTTQVSNLQIQNATDGAIKVYGPPSGSNSYVYVATVTIRDIFAYGSNVGVLFSGGSQGINIENFSCQSCNWGVFSDSTANLENIVVSNSYLEGNSGGILLTNIAFAQVMGNSFDTLSTQSSSWHAITLGTSSQPVVTANVENNQIFGIQGRQTGTVIQVYSIDGGSVSGNTVQGLVNTPHCIQAGRTSSNSSSNDIMTVTGNACWAAGDISTTYTDTATARGNIYTTSSGTVGTLNQN